ncbi:hypothetical protein EN851_20285 [Mesorhizobium sp. M8A.F.Ca.ET.208.01.1.1]|uniref:hypothetical protein n=1 Tax=unclassified Mesorhizobium TaxID=325217 RepID=UPI0010941014|nr:MULTISPECIES: hypothetical protein [unclassified Mesorhizobium]TGQ89976.1 hypothetical protein EN851_20285 [Mesorhizobium sp. M8A.F.Ca.ET.208.01.1.1]TGT50815.1 hypothetical protein EN810_20185 [Mesorhizobium sp. M8A.F.Ca.ET.167.01.1.1]
MPEVIIDTNVAVIANRQNSNVITSCVDACVVFLAAARNNHVILIDAGDEIRAEYAGALKMRRPYELGAQFLIYVLQQQHNPDRVKRVQLDKTAGGAFSDFPTAVELATFDQSDRKFAALSAKTKVAVTNATDSDWSDHAAALGANGIVVDFLCGCDKTKWFTA